MTTKCSFLFRIAKLEVNLRRKQQRPHSAPSTAAAALAGRLQVDVGASRASPFGKSSSSTAKSLHRPRLPAYERIHHRIDSRSAAAVYAGRRWLRQWRFRIAPIIASSVGDLRHVGHLVYGWVRSYHQVGEKVAFIFTVRGGRALTQRGNTEMECAMT